MGHASAIVSGFHRDGAIVATLSDAERSVLEQLTSELLHLLGEADEHDDPLAAAIGISTNDQLPEDPALARLLPDAYQNPAHASEFRRYTEHGLRDGKRQRLEELAAGLGGRIELSNEAAQRWAMAINDIRLFLGTRLEIEPNSEEIFDRIPDDDPRKAGYVVFAWLGWLQETLIEALTE